MEIDTPIENINFSIHSSSFLSSSKFSSLIILQWQWQCPWKAKGFTQFKGSSDECD